MNVLVDSSVWSLALRRNTTNEAIVIVNVLRDLIADGRVVLLGAIRQEVLSGVRYKEQFSRLQEYLRAFPDLELTTEDFELAAEFFNTCRTKGVQGSNTDFLLCAVAHCRGYSIFTTDKDFENFRSHIPVILL
ncbi:PIN domain-containing protein [Planktothrix agardhii]|jgi:predicted nucleic acid-binding protein|uniref:type II toxin-antitoxin system VapC family toxin n=1 Tax=Planktothrix agardhii TaxID=1160 RepID=UPI001F239801|nr:PIN domain-containing protein [Planktothrix agardhii]MCF3576694.1 PIN domain-containing protein [Planktothrix agardhii 1812]MCF3582727.1 PIN domain-containing protein [Planktothrix agardhii 1811]MCF3624057.1 PIN domain-containing protein [Planktothrix agardhii 1801]